MESPHCPQTQGYTWTPAHPHCQRPIQLQKPQIQRHWIGLDLCSVMLEKTESLFPHRWCSDVSTCPKLPVSFQGLLDLFNVKKIHLSLKTPLCIWVCACLCIYIHNWPHIWWVLASASSYFHNTRLNGNKSGHEGLFSPEFLNFL